MLKGDVMCGARPGLSTKNNRVRLARKSAKACKSHLDKNIHVEMHSACVLFLTFSLMKTGGSLGVPCLECLLFPAVRVFSVKTCDISYCSIKVGQSAC